MIESPEDFLRLRNSEDLAEQREASAGAASLEVWETLISRYPDERFWVAQNKTVPLEILQRLASDPDSRVREMVARKRKLPAVMLDALSRDRHESVRMAVALHKNVSRETLEALLADSWGEIQEVARSRLHG